MVIKTEMYPGGGYKQMSYSHEEEVYYADSYYHNNNGSSMQMRRPNPCISTPQPAHCHLVTGAGKHHNSYQHGHNDYDNKEKCYENKEKYHHEGSHGKDRYHNAHGQNYHGNGHMQKETLMFSSDRLVSGGHEGYGNETHYASHTVVAPNKHETMKYSSGPDRRMHCYDESKRMDYFEFKDLDD